MLDQGPEHVAFRAMMRRFLARDVVPQLDRWERNRRIDRAFFVQAGSLGLLGLSVPEEYGGPGVDDFRYNAIVIEETNRVGAVALGLAFALQNDVVLPYLTGLARAEQKSRWLPRVVTGESLLAIAMTEPGAGSDLAGIRTSAVRDGEHYVVNGSKTFISNGQNADLFVVAVRTSPEPHHGLTLLAVEAGTPGFARGRNLDKIGLHAQDTSELSFRDARVPATHRLGLEGEGFFQLVHNLPQERLSLAVGAVAAAEGVLAGTLRYIRERTAFGQRIGDFQQTHTVIAELATELDAARAYVDDCVREHLAGELSAARAARVKWWTTELQFRVADRCLQLYGGYGYMREYPISRAFVDARAQTIYGGTTEILKELIARDLIG
ncbi:acyl-CoA dehydrogenase family protein [Specibacter cremeus]|uniref:acyl-CoA dehydrogenase family protein n=1 Tax=Specibacter cremeus TaxID=1629051 RepID=UPI000F7746F9|nr:acyl-CoA dehydrogenase family protein [Specibacter cremeus]